MKENEPTKASFSFEDFKIVNFSFKEKALDNEPISINIKPSGIYYTKTGIFEETLEFTAFENDKKDDVFIEVKLKATFLFERPNLVTEIPSYFYLNSIAIVFPYLRAFITNLTVQANIKPMILPVLNLTGLDQPLRDNTKVVNEETEDVDL